MVPRQPVPGAVVSFIEANHEVGGSTQRWVLSRTRRRLSLLLHPSCKPPAGETFAILDPCAGEGTAIRQLGELLGCPPIIDSTPSNWTTAVQTRFMLPCLKPTSWLQPTSSVAGPAVGSFSFIWLNPPFDYSYGGNRVEEQFLWRATDWLMPGGVMALVCPEDVVDEFSDARQHFARFYENVTMVPFPEAHRPFQRSDCVRAQASKAGSRSDERLETLGFRPGSDEAFAIRFHRAMVPACSRRFSPPSRNWSECWSARPCVRT